MDIPSLQATLLRHMTSGLLLSGGFPVGSSPVVSGGGEEITVTTTPAPVGHLAIASQFAAGNIIEVDNEAANGVIHVIDIVL